LGRATAVHPDRSSNARALAPAGDQISDPHRIGNTAVQFGTACEEPAADKVDVLEVEEDRHALNRGHQRSSQEKKAPPVPEEGGE
jgi:hypothetical protein